MLCLSKHYNYHYLIGCCCCLPASHFPLVIATNLFPIFLLITSLNATYHQFYLQEEHYSGKDLLTHQVQPRMNQFKVGFKVFSFMCDVLKKCTYIYVSQEICVVSKKKLVTFNS